ncbi:MAG: hypothetical protein ACAH82_16410 [Solirubrobacteraceae bacterium]
MTPAPARSHRRIHGRSHAPQAPRRVSGPVQRRLVPAPAGPVGLPRRGTTGFFARVRALPDHRLIDRLLRSRLWIWALGIALLGVVTMQVSLLKLNSGISRAVETTTTLERQNAALEESITKLTATDRIQTGAEALGMLMPAAGDVGYLQAGPNDADRAVSHMEPPSDEAAALLANNGVVPGSMIAPTVAATTTPSATAPAATTTTTPVAPVATPAPTTAPVTTAPTQTVTPQTPTTTSAPAAGGVVAAQG